MAYIQFLSEELISEERVFLDIMLSAYRIKDVEAITCYYNREFGFWKKYEGVEERVNFLSPDIKLYNKYLKFSDEENPCVVLNAIEGKRLISLFSADKVRSKRLLFEFAKEYVKIKPNDYLLIDDTELYDLRRLEELMLD